MNSLIYLIPFVFLINLPCGYWREGVRKFSFQWFLAIHLPVPFIVLARKLVGIELSWMYVLLIVPAYFIGQRVGVIIRRRKLPAT